MEQEQLSDNIPERSPHDKAWDTFLETQATAGFMQTSWWADFLVTLGWGHFGIVLKDGETIVGGTRVMTHTYDSGKSYYYIPEGPVLPEDDEDGEQVFQYIRNYITEKCKHDQNTISHLHLETRWTELPEFINGFLQPRGWMEPRTTLYINLLSDESALLAQMKPKGRYNIGLARRRGVTIVEDLSLQGLEDFYAIYNDTTDRHELRKKKRSYFHAMLARLAAFGQGSIFFAEYQGKRIATALVIYFGRRATYFYGGSLTAHRDVMAPYLMHFEIMLKAKARGCEWYDLYGVAPVDEPDHKWANISVFKRKLGGQDMKFVPPMDFVYDPNAYQDYLRR
jgi:peptidoglycan pentaglycine glycine transferase (the first glycine)